ncbi:MAG: (2Fe-2S)-binding protein [Planctomycetes bacterium]|nr:(2Fe-2S)-binding protein [Planctomycetota bacterium]
MPPARAARRPVADPRTAEPPRVRCARRANVLRPLPGETLLDAARRQSVPLASPCGGRAVCGDCLVAIIDGADAFPPPDADETAWRARKSYDGRGRLACCVRVTGDCTVGTTYW